MSAQPVNYRSANMRKAIRARCANAARRRFVGDILPAVPPLPSAIELYRIERAKRQARFQAVLASARQELSL